MNLESIILSEVAEIQTKITFSHVCNLAYYVCMYVNRQKWEIYETKNETISVVRGVEEEEAIWHACAESRQEGGERQKGAIWK